MKKNILFLIESLNDGGSEKSISKIASELSQKYNVLLVLANNKNKDYEFNGTIIEMKEFISKNPIKRIIGINKLKKIKKEYHINISISYITAYNLYNVLSKYKDNIFISIRNHLSAKKEGIIAKIGTIYSNKKADKIICCSKSIQTDQINHFKAKKEKTIVIENYIDTLNHTDSKKEINIITIGRLTKHKGQEHIIKAMSLVIKKIPDVKLLILGRGPNKEYLDSLIKTKKLQNNIKLIGYTKDINTYLQKSKIFILASDYEGFSNALLEAMSYSLPVIATNSPGGNHEILTEKEYKHVINHAIHEKYGILIPTYVEEHHKNEITQNEKILAQEIIQLLTNKKDYNYYKNQSKKRAKDYSKEIIINKWLAIIEEES